ncbi:hypothetical protein HU200_028918 [Digitaria exilis]|uniref:peptidylprolyl isomerase n=1 Tax=Digitaria exilis TaxID=1010633 RepID=A0A835BUX0_9POAL|nr:hypothetical protein HU200_028918 [Digitaria exilis]
MDAGVEVKPGKPYTHAYQADHGRLRVCQAFTLPFYILWIWGEADSFSDTDEEHDADDDSYESDFIDDRDVPTPEKYGSDFIDVSDDDDECSSPRHPKQKVACGKQTRKAERRRRLKKQVDSPADSDDDSPVMKPAPISVALGKKDKAKVAVKRNACSIFDSGSDEEDNVPISVASGKKDGAKVAVKRNASIFDSGSDDEDLVPLSVAPVKNGSAKVAEEANPQNGQINDGTKKKSNEDAKIKKKSKKKMRNQSGEKDEKQSNVRTLEDGLMVEDLSAGNVDAKVASDGCKVYIKYVGMLKDGKIVESNLNEKPYKFKLGNMFAKTRMRVGDKRRLTVPPSMCSGGKSVLEVPKNSSVIYEIELVKVK